MPTLEDDGFVLWESNAILFYMAAKRPDRGLWPSDLRGQAEVLRWLAWESAHWDAESWGMVVFEKASKAVLGLGPPDPAFIARGEQNFARLEAGYRFKHALIQDAAFDSLLKSRRQELHGSGLHARPLIHPLKPRHEIGHIGGQRHPFRRLREQVELNLGCASCPSRASVRSVKKRAYAECGACSTADRSFDGRGK